MANNKIMTVDTKRRPLLLSRRFAPLFVLFQTGTFNDNALKNALIGMITFGGVAFMSDLPSMIRVPVAALIFTGPFLILCAIAGQIADKLDRGVIFRWVKRAEVGIMIIAAIGFLLKDVRILAVALGLMGAQSAFFSPTKNAVLPQWLDSDELIRANGLMSGVQFAVLLIGTILGLKLVTSETGPIILASMMFVLALIGWFSAEACPPAKPPSPDLKIDYNPITAIAAVLKKILAHPDVLRPWLGIAWFYALSTIFITAFPDFIATQMRYESNVLQIVLVISTVAILSGSLLTTAVGNLKIWGPEAIRLVMVGIFGITGFSLLLYLAPEPQYTGELDFGPVSEFLKDPNTPLFLIALAGTSMFNGMFVVPLQAMAQRRAHPRIRAQLMSAGAVLINFSVNIVTFGLIGLAVLKMPAKAPFLMVVIGSASVSIYAIWRVFHLQSRKQY
jgi:hypothetical protein